MANASIYAAFERMWQHIVAGLGTKVDKVSGKNLSSNDYTDEDKNKLNNIDTVVSEQISSAMEELPMIDIDLSGSNEGEANLINADTLGGHLPEHYATAEVVNGITLESLGATSLELLWELSEGATSMDAGELTLTSGEYSHYMVDFRISPRSVICRNGVSNRVNFYNIGGGVVGDSTADTTINFYERKLNFANTKSTNKVVVSDCYNTYYSSNSGWIANGSRVQNGSGVPYRIWGIKGVSV